MGQPTFNKWVTSWYVGRGQKKGLSSSGPGAKAQRYGGSSTLRTRLSVVIKWRAGMRPRYPAIVLREARGVSPPNTPREGVKGTAAENASSTVNSDKKEALVQS